MREFASLLGGIGLLIGGYLILSNAGPAATVAQGLTAAGVDTISVLQGKATTVAFPNAA